MSTNERLDDIEARAEAATEARRRYNVPEIRQPEILSALHKSQKDVPGLLDLARKQQAAIEYVRDELEMAEAFERPISGQHIMDAMQMYLEGL